MKRTSITRFTAVNGAMLPDENGLFVELQAHADQQASQHQEILALHQQLAGAQLHAQNGWQRYDGANKSRASLERQLQDANSALQAAQAQLALFGAMMENVTAAAGDTAPSWGHRIAAIMGALGMDYGTPESINFLLAHEVLGPVGEDVLPADADACSPTLVLGSPFPGMDVPWTAEKKAEFARALDKYPSTDPHI